MKSLASITIKILFFILILYVLFFLSEKLKTYLTPRYEGLTAEEWYYKYNELKYKYDTAIPVVEKSLKLEKCINKTRSQYVGAINKLCGQGTDTQNMACLYTLVQNDAVTVILNQINKSKIECYDKYYE